MNRAQAIVDSLIGEAEPWERDHYGELQARIARKKALHNSSGTGEFARERAKAYFGDPYKFPLMKQYTVGKVTPAPEPPAKSAEPSLTIKGRDRWMPKHYAMPKPWTKWR